MLATVLAVLIGISSLTFYMAAFFYPEVHRRTDFLWSGLGLFYAVILWFCAGQMTPTVLLGQVTAAALLVGLGWQVLSVRREKTPVYQQTPVVLTPERVGNWAKAKLNQLRIAPDETIRPELQTRSLTAAASARLRQSLDPRRRPTYDYEFVEDGLPESRELTAEAMVDTPLSTAGFDEQEEERRYAMSPSVEAEVLVEILPEVLAVEEDSMAAEDSKPNEDSHSEEASLSQEELFETAQVSDGTALEESVSGEDFVEEQAAEKTAIEEPSNEQLDVAETVVASTQTDTIIKDALKADESDDWDDDLISSLEIDGSVPVTVSSRDKPSIAQTPLILVGWVKDMVASMTKPKPSKPMIEIPRRESVREVMNNDSNAALETADSLDTKDVPRFDQDGVDDKTSEHTDQDFARAGNFSDTHSDEVRAQESWEESNWDD